MTQNIEKTNSYVNQFYQLKQNKHCISTETYISKLLEIKQNLSLLLMPTVSLTEQQNTAYTNLISKL